MTQPGVGPITSMAFVLTMGDVNRFQRGKQVASYLGLIPREYSAGGKQQLGPISKQGNTFLRMLLVEAAQGAVRCDPGMRSEYLHRCHQKAKGVAKVAAARKLECDCTGCCAPTLAIQRPFVSRAARGWRWSAPARPQG
jgi:transposase